MGDDVNPDRDDLPLRANTSHILVRHYVLDLDIHFHTQVITGTLVLFLEPGPGAGEGAWAGEGPGAGEGDLYTAQPSKTADSWEDESNGDFTLVLDCCDLAVSKVEELDVASVLDLLGLLEEVRGEESVVEPQPGSQSAVLIQRLISLPATQWKKQHHLYSQCSRAPASESGRPLVFHTDRWSLQVRHRGTRTPQEFPRALRICYETKPEGGSVRWTKDQDNRSCVYTAGSPINNRALFPCQEPPVAMSTWQARVRAPRGCVVLLSGENQAEPTHLQETGLCSWDYYVTMPMPASTFTLAVGSWNEKHFESGCTVSGENNVSCCHVDYPCRFTEASAWSQRIIPHRVFAPPSLVPKAQFQILPLLPRCLAAAHATLGVHPFPRLDILIVPAGFSSLGMASPHIIFLSQSVLCGERDGVGGVQPGLSLCGSRLCHELSHSWFGLAIGARDWTEEWISEGFATYLEDVIWARAQQLSRTETDEQSKLKALLRWRRLSEELQNSEDQLQILRPNMESTGQVSESGSSFVKHALNPEKNFMQVHYLKGYFLLRFLASKVEDERFLSFFKLFVMKYHGQLILSQVDASALLPQITPPPPPPPPSNDQVTPEQLVLLLELLLEEAELSVTSLCTIQRTYNLQEQDAEVRHRWCELVVKHKHTEAYHDVEHFLQHDQAMGVYLYGELMVHEDARQQALARHCLSLLQDEMDQSARRVVEEMVL
uniref:Peptidase M1 leukotriene A4 hydrolase/aminopeptidase C-terminal domain-containing protein n=1 Tax=Esox lucius TaxID=8010 RepID=A0AAY5KKU2_ESOLU